MKKTLITLLIILALATIAIFVFIPSTIKVSHSVFIHTTEKWANKYVSDSTQWEKWFPKKENTSIKAYNLNGVEIALDSIFYNGVKIGFTYDGQKNSSIMHFLSLKQDSLAIVWDTDFETGMNPATRLEKYGFALRIKKSMTDVLDSLKSFLGETKNVYGFHIVHAKILDSILISTKKIYPEYPTDEQVAALMQQLHDHYDKYGAKQNGNPMLNITHNDAAYQTQVAVPINKDVPETDAIRMKYMYRGNTLRTDVTGGHATINEGLAALHQYKSDFGFITPAIAFQSIITDRMAEKDSSKWKTILFYPVK